MKLVSIGIVLSLTVFACGGEADEQVSASDSTQSQALVGRPPCTPANEGAKIRESIPRGYQILQCQSGTWEPIRRCQTGGVCVDL